LTRPQQAGLPDPADSPREGSSSAVEGPVASRIRAGGSTTCGPGCEVPRQIKFRVPPTMFRVPPTMHRGPPTMFRVPPTMHRGPPTMFRVPPTMFRVPPTMHRVPPTMFRVPPTMFRRQPTMFLREPTMFRRQPTMLPVHPATSTSPSELPRPQRSPPGHSRPRFVSPYSARPFYRYGVR
jgi:hypothetical protein